MNNYHVILNNLTNNNSNELFDKILDKFNNFIASSQNKATIENFISLIMEKLYKDCIINPNQFIPLFEEFLYNYANYSEITSPITKDLLTINNGISYIEVSKLKSTKPTLHNNISSLAIYIACTECLVFLENTNNIQNFTVYLNHAKQTLIPYANKYKLYKLVKELEDIVFKLENPVLYETIKKQFLSYKNSYIKSAQDLINNLNKSLGYIINFSPNFHFKYIYEIAYDLEIILEANNKTLESFKNNENLFLTCSYFPSFIVNVSFNYPLVANVKDFQEYMQTLPDYTYIDKKHLNMNNTTVLTYTCNFLFVDFVLDSHSYNLFNNYENDMYPYMINRISKNLKSSTITVTFNGKDYITNSSNTILDFLFEINDITTYIHLHRIYVNNHLTTFDQFLNDRDILAITLDSPRYIINETLYINLNSRANRIKLFNFLNSLENNS